MTTLEELKSTVKDLLDLNEDTGLFDTPREQWADGDGFIATDGPSQSMELTLIISRLRELIEGDLE